MLNLQQEPTKDTPFSISISQNPNSTLKDGRFLGPLLYNWLFECHGFFHNVTLISASLAFLLYLAFEATKSIKKLSHGRSYIMIAYYGCLWLVSLLNFAWCCLQAWECTPGKELAWNILSLFTTSGMLFLEVSLIAFLLQGNYASGLEALTRTFAISALIVGLDILLKGIYLFVLGIPLFIDNNEFPHHMKWNLWVVHRLVLTAIYGIILFMYHSKWRERLPARPAFYKYVVVMFTLNALALFACGLSGNGAGFGYWLYGTTIVCYHALYLPLIYITFLADFFQATGGRFFVCLLFDHPFFQLLAGRRFASGKLILFRDERCRFLRCRLGLMSDATKNLYQDSVCNLYIGVRMLPGDRRTTPA